LKVKKVRTPRGVAKGGGEKMDIFAEKRNGFGQVWKGGGKQGNLTQKGGNGTKPPPA